MPAFGRPGSLWRRRRRVRLGFSLPMSGGVPSGGNGRRQRRSQPESLTALAGPVAATCFPPATRSLCLWKGTLLTRFRFSAAAATVVSMTVVAFSFMTAAPAFAHELRTVGAYQITVGWEVEPAYVGQTNSVELFVHDAKGTALDDIGANGLKVQVTTGSQTSDPLAMKGAFDPDTGLGLHGQYLASIIPTSPGDYTFHFAGDINSQKIDEKFTSSDKTFNPVTDPTAVEFPAKNPTISALSASIGQLTPRVDNARSVGTAATASAKSAKNSASTATTLGTVGLVVGIVALLIGVFVGVSGRRRAAA